ncbi:MAG TPA: tetratricopeptide repeat protein [Flavobacteriales bacterium]|nr:tetratricopeptide repeat protein [Flavobacteriales bacterium]HRJ39991.1 tetratricopeptide repeat protein [Flavobacteriales bacterium]
MKRILILFLLLSTNRSYAQAELDQLYANLENAKSENEKCDLYNEIALIVVNSDPEQAREYATKALQSAEKANYKDGMGFAYYNYGNINYYLDEYEEGKKNLGEAKKIFEGTGNEKGLGYVFNTSGEILTLEGAYGDALTNLFEALKHFEKIKDNVGLARVNNNIGLIHYYQKNYEEALKYFNQALVTADETRVGDASLYIGRVFIEKNNYTEAETYLKKALEIGVKNEDNYIISDCYYLLGRIDAFYGESEKAMDEFQKSMALKEQLEDGQGIALCSIHIGNLYLNQKDAAKARNYFYRAITLAKEIGIREELKDAYLGLSNAYHYEQQFDSAFFYLDLHNEVFNELLSEEASKKLAKLEASLESQRREAQIESERKLQEYTRKVIVYSGIAIIFVLLVVAYMMYNRYRLKQKANEQLQSYNDQLKQFNDEITHQKEIIEEKNRDIMDSIRYAKRIQEAILPAHDLMSAHIRDFFVLYRPKDIVSGDFYWSLPIQENGRNKILFAAVDCTGHGVPGAFVSIVGYNGLNRAVKEFHLYEPSKILDKLTELVEDTFKQQGSSNIKDGMDITLCSLEYLDNETAVLKFAAANNPLWIFRNGTEWEEVKADKQPIGAFDDRKPYTQHEFILSKGDTFYIFSDGYPDQFGGDKGKKYKYSKFRDYLQAIIPHNMEKQKELLSEEIVAWTGDLEQVDDQCVIGIRI